MREHTLWDEVPKLFSPKRGGHRQRKWWPGKALIEVLPWTRRLCTVVVVSLGILLHIEWLGTFCQSSIVTIGVSCELFRFGIHTARSMADDGMVYIPV